MGNGQDWANVPGRTGVIGYVRRRTKGEVRKPPQSITVFPHVYDAEQSQCGLRALTRKTVFSNNAGRAPVIGVGPDHILFNRQCRSNVHTESANPTISLHYWSPELPPA